MPYRAFEQLFEGRKHSKAHPSSWRVVDFAHLEGLFFFSPISKGDTVPLSETWRG